MSGLACPTRLDFVGSGPLTASLVRAHRGLEAHFTTNRDCDQLMAVFR